MEKINQFISKYGIIILVIILFICGSYQNKTMEPMICDLKRPKYNYFFSDFEHLIKKYELRDKEIKLLKSLFDRENFKDTNYNKDNKNLSEYIKVNNIEGKKDDFIGAVNELIDNNRIWDNKNNYKITLDSKLSQLRHIWLLDTLVTDLRCILDMKEIDVIRSQIKKILKETPIKLCSQKELLGYCSTVSANPKMGKFNSNTLDEEEESLKKSGQFSKLDEEQKLEMKDFKLLSVKDNVSKFGKGYYPEPLNSILMDLYDKFEEKYSRKLDNYDRNDLTKLALIYVPILQNLVNENMALSTNNSKKVESEKTLNNNKKLFYLIKHQYKLVSIYNLINTLVTEPAEKELAYKCCVGAKDKTNICYDFAKHQEESEPIFYGFEKYGYVKNTPCSPETNKNLLDLQMKSLEARLSENSFWISIPSGVKNKFYSNFTELLNYFLVKKLDSKFNLSKASIITLLGKFKEQNMELILPEKLDTVANDYTLTYDEENEEDKVIDTINLSTAFSTIKKLAEQSGIDEQHFNLASLGENIPKLKFAVINLIKIRSLLLSYRANEGSVNRTIVRMLALVPSDYNYYQIMIKGGIPIRNHDSVLSEFIKILMKIRLIKLDTFTLTKKPREVITYLEKIFPSGKDLDICSIYKPVLMKLRSLRNITPIEYVHYKDNFGVYCNSRDSLLNKNKPILFKDIFDKIVETYDKKIDNIKGRMVSVLTTLNSNGEIELLNVNKNNRVEYSGLVFRANSVYSLTETKNNIRTVSTIKIGEDKKHIIGKTKIKLEGVTLDEAEDPNPINNYKADEVLDGTNIDTKVDDSNKNILNLINNYFDFEK